MQAIETTPSSSPDTSDSHDSATYTVLVVDPDGDSRAEIAEQLRLANPNFTVVEAESGKVALDLAEEISFDCAVLEYYQPDHDGLCLLDMLRETNSLRLIPAILVTDNGNEALAVEALRAGAANYFTKASVGGAQLCQAIHHAVADTRIRHAMNLDRDALTQRLYQLERQHAVYERERQGMAHALLTPTASIQEFISLVLDGVSGPITEEQGKHLAYARGACAELKHQLSQMTLSSQIDSRAESLQVDIAVDKVLSEVAASFETETEFRRVHIGTAVEDRLPRAHIEPIEFKQVVSHLISHALSVCNEGSTVLVLAATNHQQPGHITITVHASLDIPSYNQEARTREYSSIPEIFHKGNHIIETSFDNGLTFSFDVPTTTYQEPNK